MNIAESMLLCVDQRPATFESVHDSYIVFLNALLHPKADTRGLSRELVQALPELRRLAIECGADTCLVNGRPIDHAAQSLCGYLNNTRSAPAPDGLSTETLETLRGWLRRLDPELERISRTNTTVAEVRAVFHAFKPKLL